MQQTIDRFAALVPGFGERSLRLTDLHRQCVVDRIDVIELPMRKAHGLSWTDEDGDCIYINSLITESQKVIAGFHEICHHICHPTQARILASLGPLVRKGKWEIEANAIGIIALIPTPALFSSIMDIAEEFDVSHRVVAFRLQLFSEYKI